MYTEYGYSSIYPELFNCKREGKKNIRVKATFIMHFVLGIGRWNAKERM